MKPADQLSEFVRDAMAQGGDHDRIAQALRDAGWSAPEIAEALKAEFARRDGRMPDAIFANGITALEGLFLAVPGVGLGELSHKAIACYDWDPFAGNLPMNIIFARQDVEGLIAAGFRLLEIGTGNSGFGQIALYERCGFVRCGIDVDYFRKHSPTPIFENGVECRHMVRLRMELV